jgi:energy-coupling factor transporter ATP-binding protein EcfA2
MDFFQIVSKESKRGDVELYPEFVVKRSDDLMVRGKSFYAIWNDATKLWSTDEYDVVKVVDKEMHIHAAELRAKGVTCGVRDMQSFSTNSWRNFRQFMVLISDNSHDLDSQLIFANTETKKSDHASKKLPYSLEEGDHSAWDELIDVLYAPEERQKIEWAIGSVVAGVSKDIQKFIVLYGAGGTGKSTVLNIIEKLFKGYTTTFDAKALGSNNNQFATESFKANALVAIQHDGDLSKIEDNTKLNSIVSHEEMAINEKYKPLFSTRIHAFLFMGTNQPVKISDAKSGIIRRLIDVVPTGNTITPNHYHALLDLIDKELGAIAWHCKEVFKSLGKNHYKAYYPLGMMFQTDIVFNFIEASYDIFKEQDGTSLKQAYTLYKEYCNDSGIERPLPQYKLREELRNYFEHFTDRKKVDGKDVRSYYEGFKAYPFKTLSEASDRFTLCMDDTISIFDHELSEGAAQYAKDDETPQKRWSDVRTSLSDIDTSRLHYVKVPENHIVIDFDLRDDDGAKSLEKNLEAAGYWPATYAELSKSGSGVHLHYIYNGDTAALASEYLPGIEVKAFTGNSSLRRRLTKCNNVPIVIFTGDLPVKEKRMLSKTTIQSEKGLRDLIARNLRKEIHPGTKSSIDFIHKILEDAYLSGMQYDVTDLRSPIVAFANNSTNQPLQALKIVQGMRFTSEAEPASPGHFPDQDGKLLVFFDVEVYPNLFVVCWKYEGSDQVVKMLNPSPQAVEDLFEFRLVGFNNRRYDNHILYARYMGYDNEKLYQLSQKIINGAVGSMFGEAYSLSYADIYDFSSKKQGLKKFEIELGITHMELNFPWDKPVPEEHWGRVVSYCENDVRATEAVFIARKQDFVARQILADLSGLSVNDTTQKHTARIIFGSDRNPQKDFVYTDLSEQFFGYQFEAGKSYYKGEEPGEGGYVYSEPGMYENVAVLDVASMHPTTIVELDLFGPKYTPKFAELVEARLAIKREDYKKARTLLGGKLIPYLGHEDEAKALSYALKIVINIVYGLTSAQFDNPFRDIRNRDNIVAKRGALFMIDLKKAVQKQGFQVVHIKTDSIKIPNATDGIVKFVKSFGADHGYLFEHETTYEKFCLVNDAVYVAKAANCLNDGWTAVGAQFQHPYVFKTLFYPKEPTLFDDFCETKHVTQGAMYLDFDVVQKPMHAYKSMHFVGRTGRFVPVVQEEGGILYKVKDDRPYAVTGTKGYFWNEASMVKHKLENGDPDPIDYAYFEHLVEEAERTIRKFGDVDAFLSRINPRP